MADPSEYDQTRHRDDVRVEQVMRTTWGFREQHLINEYAGRMASDIRESEPSPDSLSRTGGGRDDEVTWSVFSPRLAAPGDELLLQVYAHLPGKEGEVAAMAGRADNRPIV